MIFADFHELCSDFLRFSRTCGKTLQLLEISRFQFNFSMIIPDINFIFLYFRFHFRFNFRFNFHIGTSPAPPVAVAAVALLARTHQKLLRRRLAGNAAGRSGSVPQQRGPREREPGLQRRGRGRLSADGRDLASQFEFWACQIQNFRNLIPNFKIPNSPKFHLPLGNWKFGGAWWRFQIPIFTENPTKFHQI